MVKRAEDYFEKLYEMFPTVEKSDIKRIVNYGYRMLFKALRRGCDVNIKSKDGFWIYFGQLTNNSVEHHTNYRKKLLEKIHYLYNLRIKNWDGYYYTALLENEYDPKQIEYIIDRPIIKSIDYAKLFFNGFNYIIRFKYPEDLGFIFKKDKMVCKQCEVVLHRDGPMKLADMLVDNKKYEIL